MSPHRISPVGCPHCEEPLILSVADSLISLFLFDKEPNIFAACTDVQLLVKCTSPPIQQGQIRSRTSSIVQKSRLHPAVPVLHEVYRDAKPPTPMHRSSYAFRRDPLHRHGAQMLELKRIERKGEDLFIIWSLLVSA